MDPREFLVVAAEWATGAREAEWRSAVSWAYYSAYHVARQLLVGAGFALPDGPTGHAAVWFRLANAGQPDIATADNNLKSLRDFRNRADYDLDTPVPEALAVTQVGAAQHIVNLLDQLAAMPTALAQVVAAIRHYEINVLQDVTYRAP